MAYFMKGPDDKKVIFGNDSDFAFVYDSGDDAFELLNAADEVVVAFEQDKSVTFAGLAGAAGLVRNDVNGKLSGGNQVALEDLPAHNHTAAGEGGDYAWADITGLAASGVATTVARSDTAPDTMGALSDTTTMDVSTAAHGFAPKIPAGSAGKVAKVNDAGTAIEYVTLTSVPPAVHPLAGHSVSGLTAGHFLKALTPTTYGFAALVPGDIGAATDDHVQGVTTGGTAVETAPDELDILIGNATGGYDLRAGTPDDFGAQAADDNLDDISALSPSAGTLIGGDGANFVSVVIGDIPLDSFAAASDGSALVPAGWAVGKVLGENSGNLAWVDAGTPGAHDGATAHTSVGVALGKVPVAQGDDSVIWDYPSFGALSESDVPVHDPIAYHDWTGNANEVLRFSATDTLEAGPLVVDDIPDLSGIYPVIADVVPYVGATTDLNLGSNDLILSGSVLAGALAVNSEYVLPLTDGTTGQILYTAGDSSTYWGDAPTSGVGGFYMLRPETAKTGHFSINNRMGVVAAGNRIYLMADYNYDQYADFQFTVPPSYASNLALKLAVNWKCAATSGAVTLATSIMATTGGDAALIETDDFDSETSSGAVTVPGTAGHMLKTVISIADTDRDDMAALDLITVRLKCAAGGASGNRYFAGLLFYWEAVA